ncbi:hypothetical protein [Thermoactinomyces sp. CICC 23799]|jgi:hypothetical protein|uniref:hypothetical protein n=1 Tax=Thermoactinomyces TaxID=2023 RepID=UPI0018DAF8BA|nr:hypothetical protein [Thermoactinomyces sp. CICC 23799]MBH8600126.1 hypothetical protein [Thermoactinomyces sp. CICC 23799]
MANKPLPVDSNYRSASAFNKSMRWLDHTYTGTVAAETGLDLQIPAPEGFVSTVEGLHVYIKPITGATTGQHGLVLYYGKDPKNSHLDLVQIAVPPDEAIEIKCGTIIRPSLDKVNYVYPSDLAAMNMQMKSLHFGGEVFFGIWYYNESDGTQDQPITRLLVIQDEQVIN